MAKISINQLMNQIINVEHVDLKITVTARPSNDLIYDSYPYEAPMIDEYDTPDKVTKLIVTRILPIIEAGEEYRISLTKDGNEFPTIH